MMQASKVSTWKRDRTPEREPEVNLRLPRGLVRDLGLDKSRVRFEIFWDSEPAPLMLCFREVSREDYK